MHDRPQLSYVSKKDDFERQQRRQYVNKSEGYPSDPGDASNVQCIELVPTGRQAGMAQGLTHVRNSRGKGGPNKLERYRGGGSLGSALTQVRKAEDLRTSRERSLFRQGGGEAYLGMPAAVGIGAGTTVGALGALTRDPSMMKMGALSGGIGGAFGAGALGVRARRRAMHGPSSQYSPEDRRQVKLGHAAGIAGSLTPYGVGAAVPYSAARKPQFARTANAGGPTLDER